MDRLPTGALVSWKRGSLDHGAAFKLQIARTKEDFRNKDFLIVSFTLNDRQIHAFAREMADVASKRGLRLAGPRRWWQILRPRAH